MNVQHVLARDAIPSIDDPSFGTEYFGDPDDEVLVVKGDQPRAYPLRILGSHEIVNDTVDGRPIAVTWCPICWSGAVYDRRVDGQTLTFGTSGKLADDVLVMYDRETESEWQQSTGTAIAGELEGRRLALIDGPVLTWERFTTRYPDGVVLKPVRRATDSGRSPETIYEMDPYRRYSEHEEFGLYGMRGEGPRRSWNRDSIDAKTIVLGVELGDDALGFPLPRIETAGGVVTASIDGQAVVVVSTPESASAFVSPGFELQYRDGQLYGDGTTWDPDTGVAEDGRRLERLPTRRLFAFAWQDAHGPAAFYGI